MDQDQSGSTSINCAMKSALEPKISKVRLEKAETHRTGLGWFCERGRWLLRAAEAPSKRGAGSPEAGRLAFAGRLKSRCLNGFFTIKETVAMRLRFQRPLKLLFSPKPEWEGALRKSFRLSKHAVRFEAFNAGTLASCDLAVPLTLEDALFASENLHLIGGSQVLIPEPASIHLCNNKHLLNEHLIRHGFGAYVPQTTGDMGFPYILKKKTDTWGLNSHLIPDVACETALLATLDERDYFKQQLVPGSEEYATHLIVRDGRVLSSLTIKHSFRRDAFVFGMGGLRPEFRTVSQCSHLALFGNILKSIGFSGLCCVDYKLQNGIPAIFEINPRFGGSLAPFFFCFIRHLSL